jgi:hypothetical protein
MEIAAVVAGVLLGIMAVFQAALALGAPFGAAAWGGRYSGMPPPGFRLASTVAALIIYPGIITIVLNATGLVDIDWLPANSGTMWLLVAIFTVGSVANLMSQSEPERIWAPVSTAIAICCAIIAGGM